MQNGLGQLLTQLRGDESLRDAATRIGISHSYLRLLETGRDPRTGKEIKPSAEILKQISKAYRYPYEKLLKVAGYIDKHNPLSNDREPTAKELEELLRSSNVQFNGAPLDEIDKEELIEFIRFAWKQLRKKK